jgi:hypothetical protein
MATANHSTKGFNGKKMMMGEAMTPIIPLGKKSTKKMGGKKSKCKK